MSNPIAKAGVSIMGCGCLIVLVGLLMPIIFVVGAAIIIGSAE